MDSTPQSERISELADIDPADAVEIAEQLADDLETGLGTTDGDQADTTSA